MVVDYVYFVTRQTVIFMFSSTGNFCTSDIQIFEAFSARYFTSPRSRSPHFQATMPRLP